jgi:hypothetical protein
VEAKEKNAQEKAAMNESTKAAEAKRMQRRL